MSEGGLNKPPCAENFLPDNEVYEKASLIVQTTSRCSKNCPACYLSFNPEIKQEDLRQDQYEKYLSELGEGDLVALRGGEMTLVQDWFEKFVKPALNRGLKVIIETNGYFIGTMRYDDILKKLADSRISIRVSFDSSHLQGLKDENVASEFEKMARFARDAESAGINFGFYSLGMDKDQIRSFVQGTPLEPYISRFHSLTLYTQISSVKIKGRYLKADGSISEKIEP